MPENTIKPSEVSEVLLRQLQGIDNSLKFDASCCYSVA